MSVERQMECSSPSLIYVIFDVDRNDRVLGIFCHYNFGLKIKSYHRARSNLIIRAYNLINRAVNIISN